jgi:septum formation protein
MKIVLASASPRRRELLSMVHKDFSVRVSDIDERYDGTSVYEWIKSLAKSKAYAVPSSDDEIVIGCDTVVVNKGEILGKPKDKNDAISMLSMLSGVEHEVVTGVCIVNDGNPESFAQVSKVRFYELTKDEIERYVETGEPMDKAGSYGIQGRGCTLVERIEGDYFNIVGLPVAEVVRRLRKL